MYEVLISPTAENDLGEILEYIAVELCNPSSATRIADELERQWLSLTEMPSRFPLMDDVFLRRAGYRKLIVENFIVAYRVDEANMIVRIMHIFHSLQDYRANMRNEG